MCVPVAMAVAGATAALSMATTAYGINQQNKAAGQAMEAAETAAQNDYMLLDMKQHQMNDKATLEKFDRGRQALRERAMVTVASGEAGIGGSSVLQQIGDTFMQQEYDTDIMEGNRLNAANQNMAERQGVFADASSRYNEAKSNVSSPFASILKIGSAGVSGFASGYSMGSAFSGPAAGATAKPQLMQTGIPNKANMIYLGEVYRH
jgi:hypothetical protein